MTTREAIEAVEAELIDLLGEDTFIATNPWIEVSEEQRCHRGNRETVFGVSVYFWTVSHDRYTGAGDTLEAAVRDFGGELPEIAAKCGRLDRLTFDPILLGC